MKVVIGTDHGGFHMKEDLVLFLRSLSHEVLDVGAFDAKASDYPDCAEAVAAAVLDGRAERGVLLCGSGVGAAVAANKIPGIRACVCHDLYSAHQGVEHDALNVLVLGGLVIGREVARDLVRVFLAASFRGEERHRRRLDKVRALEAKASGHPEADAPGV